MGNSYGKKDSYKFIKELSSKGGSGTVSLVESKKLKQLFAMKEYRMRYDDMMPEEKEEYENEVAILQNLSHPLIIKYHDSLITEDSKVRIILEYADGGDFSTLIDKKIMPFEEK